MDGITLPDFNKPAKKLKEEKNVLDKIYGPFLLKFLGGTGVFTMAIKKLHNEIMDNFMRLIEVVEKVYGASALGNKQAEDNEVTDGDKKKEHWITEKWQKVIKSNFFQKTLGFLKGLASVSFITELIVFLVLLRMGIIQKFLPWIIGIVGSAIVSLIKFLPTLLKMFWNLLWNVIPKVLKEIFRAILDMLGLKDPIWGKITDFIAQFLPLLLAIVFVVTTIAPIIAGIASVLGIIWSVLTFIWSGIMMIVGAVQFVIAIISLFGAAVILIPLAIVAIVILLGVLIYKFRKQIWEFLTVTIPKYFGLMIDWIVKAFWAVIDVIVGAFSWLGNKISDGFWWIVDNIITILKVLGAIILTVFMLPVAIIVGLGILIWKFWDEIIAGFKWAIGMIPKALNWIWGKVKKAFMFYINIWMFVFKKIGKAFTWLWDVFKTGIKSISNFLYSIFVEPLMRLFKKLSKMAEPVLKKVGPVLDFVSNLFSSIKNGVSDAISSIKKTIQ